MSDAPPTAPPTAAPTRRRRRTLIAVAVALAVGMAAGEPIKAGARAAWEAIFGGDEAGHDHGADGKTTYYTCGMHPWVILPKPGLCPICHMDLTPLDPDKFTGEIAIDPVIAQNMGVRVADVEVGPLNKTVRTVGAVEADETRVRDVSLKVGGWIEKLYVDSLGAPVKAGEPLFDLYSPELFSAQEEYLMAYRRSRSGSPSAGDLLAAARDRLRFLDLTDAQITALEQRGAPLKAVPILSPWTGLVTAKRANEGMKLDRGALVFRVTDLSRVWVLATLYEYQLPYVRVGQEATMRLPYAPGQAFEGRVAYIYPTLETRTREVKARLEFDNPSLLLKPGMFASVKIRSRLGEDRTLVPREAVIDTGARQVAFVSLGEGKFEPRDVVLGVEAEGGRVEVREGLEPGEKVVVSGQFLLDSEARIREGIAKMIRGDLASEQEPVVAKAAVETELESLPPAADKALGQVLVAALAMGDKLASDSVEGLADLARAVAAGMEALPKVEIPDHPHFWHRHEAEVTAVRAKALELATTTKLDEARARYADLSTALTKLVGATGVPASYDGEIQQLHCPMYRGDQGGTAWLQRAGSPRNPYYGSEMLECFDERATLPKVSASTPDGKETSR